MLERTKKEINTTKELEKIILSAVPRYRGNDGASNVQRTFQAIRIEVNHELDGLADFIRQMAEKLNPGGRLAVISFHSLEDRIVKHTFRELATGCTCPSDFPICVCGKKPKAKMKYADKLEIPYILIIGEEERETKEYTLKNMVTGEQEKLNLERIIEKFVSK